MQKSPYILLFSIFVLLFSGSLLAQESSTKSILLPKDPNFKPITITPTNMEGTVKWEETFDTTVQPTDWLIVDNDGSGLAYTFEQSLTFTSGTVNPQAGQSFWYSNYANANLSGLIDEWLITPQIPTISAGDSLVFYAGAIGGSYPDSLKVLISTTDQNPTSFTEIAYFLVSGPIGAWNRYAFDLTPFAGSQIYAAVDYYIVDGGPTGNNSDNIWVDHFMVTSAAGGTITIAQAIEDLNNDFVPDRLGDTVTVQGIVFSPNYQTTNNSYYISDGTAGTDIFMYAPPLYQWAMGDELKITGVVTQYNGMSEIIPTDSTGWVFVGSGNPTPNPAVLTLGQFLANAELYEGSLVGFVGLNKVSGTWPAAGSSTNLSLSDGIDTVVFRIDSDTDIDGSPEPTWPVDVIGIGSQFDNSVPYSSGYQVFPRFYSTDFLPTGSLPVELTSFTANVSGNSVNLNWSTATELNNAGFNIERKSSTSNWANVGFVPGFGTTSEIRNYSYSDNNLSTGKYSYRLKQVDFNGAFEYSDAIEVVVVTPNNFELSQNYPNPFNPSTTIKFNLPEAGNVKLAVYNLLGQEVKTLVNGFRAVGSYSINFDASNLSSGIYIYKIEANSFIQTRKMTLLK